MVVLGSSKVGKTAIVSCFLTSRFEDAYTPTIEDFHRKFYSIRGELYQLDILDTSGSHPFLARRRLSILTGDVRILVFSLDNRDFFEEVQRLKQQILDTRSCFKNKTKETDVPLVVCGNKGDRDFYCELEPREIEQLVGDDPRRCAYVEISAKRNSSPDETFRALFAMAKLRSEMSLDLDRKVLVQYCDALHSKKALRAKWLQCAGRDGDHPGDAFGIVAPLARRQSVHSDLLYIREKDGGGGLAVRPGEGADQSRRDGHLFGRKDYWLSLGLLQPL